VIGEGIDLLAAGGRICIISFHSLEDRVVKQEFKKRAGGYGQGKSLLSPHLMRPPTIEIITRKPITPQQEEIQHNLRARSAKLRVAEKIEPC
jgi:16S rRNA (cytosine1402-N4)-methyltransferase